MMESGESRSFSETLCEPVHETKGETAELPVSEKSVENSLPKEELDASEICETAGTLQEGLESSYEVPPPTNNLDGANDSSSAEKVPSSSEERPNSIYHIKWISHNNHKTPVVTQNENGPCPLIAIINVLILKGRVKLPNAVDIVTSEKLMQHLSECILDSVPKNLPEGTQLNYEQNIHDAMSVLPKLQTGLDVNVKFTGIGDFEYTPECIIFDLLRIPLYHGWLIDPQLADVVQAVGKHSYNQLVEKIINCKSATDQDKVAEAMVAESFLKKTASQLTYHGLCELTSSLHEEELCVLFRNNHFISLVKHNNLLYQLVTDQGFLNEYVVWESLNSVEGDSQFVDANFVLVPPKPSTDIALPNDVPLDQQIDQDYLVALSLQEEQKNQHRNELEWEEYKQKNLGATDELPDEELARRLQEEENRRNACEFQPQPIQQRVPNTNSNRSRSRDCIIL